MNGIRIYNLAFLTCWLCYGGLFALVAFIVFISVLAWARQPPSDNIIQPMSIELSAMTTFLILFIVSFANFLIFLRRRSYFSILLTIIFTVGQFICVLVSCVSLFSDDIVPQESEQKPFFDAPIMWIKRHRYLLAIGIAFLPVFAVHIFLINRYFTTDEYHWVNDGGKRSSKCQGVAAVNGEDPARRSSSTKSQRKNTPYHTSAPSIRISTNDAGCCSSSSPSNITNALHQHK